MATLRREDIARHVAAQLANEFDPSLPEAVEEELAIFKQQAPSISYDESLEGTALKVAIAALLVQIASFAVQIYDVYKQESKPLPQQEEYVIEVQQKIGTDVLNSASPEKRKQIKLITQITVRKILESENL
ncbi:hypothetical protein LC612_32755 [Nostoc sp. CHAB 5834]|nr:hypothetical protein [Nostoc sp. CHAB 5834]